MTNKCFTLGRCNEVYNFTINQVIKNNWIIYPKIFIFIFFNRSLTSISNFFNLFLYSGSSVELINKLILSMSVNTNRSSFVIISSIVLTIGWNAMRLRGLSSSAVDAAATTTTSTSGLARRGSPILRRQQQADTSRSATVQLRSRRQTSRLRLFTPFDGGCRPSARDTRYAESESTRILSLAPTRVPTNRRLNWAS